MIDGRHAQSLKRVSILLASGRGAVIVTTHFGYARLIRPILRSRGVDALLVGPQGAWTWVRDGAFDNPVNPLPDAAKRRTGTA